MFKRPLLRLKEWILGNRASLLLALILFLGAYLRLSNINYVFPFTFEQAEDLVQTQNIYRNVVNLEFSKIPVKGQEGTFPFTDVGANANPIYTGVFYYFILMPAALISSFKPEGVVVFLSLLNIFSIYLFYEAGKEILEDKYLSLFATFVYAILFFPIAYSRWIWNNSLLYFFTISALYGFSKLVRDKSERNWIVFLFSLASATQIHNAGYVLLPFFLFAYFYLKPEFPKRLSTRIFSVLSLLPLFPSLLVELKSKFLMFSSLFRVFFSGRSLGEGGSFSGIVSEAASSYLEFVKTIFGWSVEDAVLLDRFIAEQLLVKELVISFLVLTVGLLLFFYDSEKSQKLDFGKMLSEVRKNKLLFVSFIFLIYFIPFPYLASLFYSEGFNAFLWVNNLHVALPFLILVFVYLGSKLVKNFAFFPILLLIFLLTVYININIVSRYYLGNSSHGSFNFGEKKEVVEAIAEDVGEKRFEVDYDWEEDRVDEFVFLFETEVGPSPERFNHTPKWSFYNRFLRDARAEVLYTIIHSHQLERLNGEIVYKTKPLSYFGEPVAEEGVYIVFRKGEAIDE